MSCEQDFINELRSRGMRMTPQREIILSVLHTVEGFVTAEDLHSRVQQHSTSIDISTLYRTLELLESMQFIARFDEEHGQRTYKLLGVHGLHHHLHCTHCGKLTGIPHEDFAPFLDRIKANYGFSIIPTSFTFSGLCAECQNTTDEVI